MLIGLMLGFRYFKSDLVYVAHVMLGQSSFFFGAKMYFWECKLVDFELTNDANRFNVGLWEDLYIY